MQEKKTPKKPLIYYYVIAMLVILLLNTLLVPLFSSGRTETVDYGTFLSRVKAGEVKEVEMDDDKIAFTADNEKGKEKTAVACTSFGISSRIAFR